MMNIYKYIKIQILENCIKLFGGAPSWLVNGYDFIAGFILFVIISAVAWALF